MWENSIIEIEEGTGEQMSNERESIISYIWDAYKDVHGVRPRWIDFGEYSLEGLYRMADDLEGEIAAENAALRSHAELVMFAMHHPRGFVWFDEYSYGEAEYGTVEAAIAAGNSQVLNAYIQSDVNFAKVA